MNETNKPINLILICHRHQIKAPGDGKENPSLEAVIQAFQQKIREHKTHRCATSNPWTGDYAYWKQTLDALYEQLDELQNLQSIQSQPTTSAQTNPSNPQITTNQPPIKNTPSKRANPGPDAELKQVTPGPTGGPHPVQPGPGPVQPTSDPLDGRVPRVPNSSPDPSQDHQNDFSFPPHLDLDLCEDAIELMASSQSPLDQLPQHQRDAIFQLLKHHSAPDVAKLLLQPPPLGLNLKVSKSSLNRFRTRYQKELNQKDQITNVDLIAKAYSAAEGNLDRAHQILIERLIAARLGKRAADPGSSAREIATLVRALNSLRRQALTEKKVHLELAEKLGWGETAQTPPAPVTPSKHDEQTLTPPQTATPG